MRDPVVRRIGTVVFPAMLLSALCFTEGGALAVKKAHVLPRNKTSSAQARLPAVAQIHVEPTGSCQLADICAGCPLKKTDSGRLSFGLFKRIFAACEGVISPAQTLFTFNGFGEGALHRDFFTMVRHVMNRGYHASWSSNALSVTREHIDAVLGLDPSKLGDSGPVGRIRRWPVSDLHDPVIYAAKMAPGLQRAVGEKSALVLEQKAVEGQISLMKALSAHSNAHAFRRSIRFDTLYGENDLLTEARQRLGFSGRNESVHNWAGQVALPESKIQPPERPCDRLDPEQQLVKLQIKYNGHVSPCCFDHFTVQSGPTVESGSDATRALHMYIGKMPDGTLDQILRGERFRGWWNRAIAGTLHETAMCGSCNRCPDGPNGRQIDGLFSQLDRSASPQGTL